MELDIALGNPRSRGRLHANPTPGSDDGVPPAKVRTCHAGHDTPRIPQWHLISLWGIPGLVVRCTQTQRPGPMTAYHRQKSGLEKRVKTKGYPLAILQTPDERPATQTSPSGKLPDVIFSIFIFGPPPPHPVTPVPGLFYRYSRGISRMGMLSPLVWEIPV
jgi:hypothetical protein